jgi:hypothetical protein
MKSFRFISLVFLLSLSVVLLASAQSSPTITINKTRVSLNGYVHVAGKGFTPQRNATSHLRKPDGTEYPVLPMLSDERGELTHDIDTLLLPVGPHELWIVDDTTKKSSNVVRFEVTNEQDRPPSQ